MAIAEKFKTFLARPYAEDMDAWGWFAFFGLIVVISLAWGIILKHIAD